MNNAERHLFIDQDMLEGAVTFHFPLGDILVFSSRNPNLNSPNEDAALVISRNKEFMVLAIADGAGGSRVGQHASNLAITTLANAVAQYPSKGSLRSSILDGFEQANQAVSDLNAGAATTLSVLEIRDGMIRPYHVGDSHIVAVGQRGKIKLQTTPHSLVGYGVEFGFLNEKEAMHHEERHIIANFIGSNDMRIEIGSAVCLAQRDTVLMASDGLTDNLYLEQILEAVRRGRLKDAGKLLVEQSLRRMTSENSRLPSKPDDLTFIIFRPELNL